MKKSEEYKKWEADFVGTWTKFVATVEVMRLKKPVKPCRKSYGESVTVDTSTQSQEWKDYMDERLREPPPSWPWWVAIALWFCVVSWGFWTWL